MQRSRRSATSSSAASEDGLPSSGWNSVNSNYYSRSRTGIRPGYTGSIASLVAIYVMVTFFLVVGGGLLLGKISIHSYSGGNNDNTSSLRPKPVESSSVLLAETVLQHEKELNSQLSILKAENENLLRKISDSNAVTANAAKNDYENTIRNLEKQVQDTTKKINLWIDQNNHLKAEIQRHDKKLALLK